MIRVVVFAFVVAFSFNSYADLSADLEKMVQQLDWDMTRIGTQGRKTRVEAIKRLTCIGKWGRVKKDRVLKTAGRLLAHENPIVVDAAFQIFENLSALNEVDRYRQNFRVRYRAPQDLDDVRRILTDLLLGEYEGLEVIREFYPDNGDVTMLNILADQFYDARGENLKIRLRVFKLEEPNRHDFYYISRLKADVIQDFHSGQRTPTESACP